MLYNSSNDTSLLEWQLWRKALSPVKFLYIGQLVSGWHEYDIFTVRTSECSYYNSVFIARPLAEEVILPPILLEQQSKEITQTIGNSISNTMYPDPADPQSGLLSNLIIVSGPETSPVHCFLAWPPLTLRDGFDAISRMRTKMPSSRRATIGQHQLYQLKQKEQQQLYQ